MTIFDKRSSLKRRKNNELENRKKPRLECTADELPWKTSSRPLETGFGGDDGILELEEVEGVEVFYESTEGGRIAKFRVSDPTEISSQTRAEAQLQPELGASNEQTEAQSIPDETITFDITLLPDWAPYSLHPQLMHVLSTKGFSAPTPIQAAVIPPATKSRDIIGVAQTGSGKTLAYGLPILHHLLSQPRPSPNKRRPVRALILAPTRELAMQVSSHLNECLNPAVPTDIASTGDDSKERSKGKRKEQGRSHPAPAKEPPHVSVAAIVGGMSSQKQRRILDRGIDVLVATPGRLWDILESDDNLAQEIKALRYLVLDEADRMIENGHFAELENILRLTLRENREDQIPSEFDSFSEEDEELPSLVSDGLQTFVLSATMSKDLQRNLKRRSRSKPNKIWKNKDEKPASTLDDLLLRLDFRDPEPQIIDLSPEGKVVSTLQEAKIECLSSDKDIYLYYFLLRHPGRTLVFLSSIDGIRRLMPLLELLNVKAFPLHSQLEQRQRLKNLDRFKSIPTSVLLATDIAARGLDIPAVDHVLHFQIPRTADTYIHRSGRTARAMTKGFSLLMIAPDERRVVRALMESLRRDESDIPELSVELGLLDKLKERIQLARQIEQSQHKVKKAKFEKNWMKETAEALGVELDSDYLSDTDRKSLEKVSESAKRQRKTAEAKAATLKTQLKAMLAQPLVARGVSTRYITSGARPIVDDLLSGESNEMLLGLKKAEAGSELVLRKKRVKNNKVKAEAKLVEPEEQTKVDGEDEWSGIQ